MSFIKTAIGSVIHPFVIDYAIWCVRLNSGRFLSERDMVRDPMTQLKRPFDWTLDLVNTGDTQHISELWLICPPNPTSPLGNTAKLPITEPGTAFQFKTRHLSVGTGEPSYHQIIGRVDNKETGDCTVFVWDHIAQGMTPPMRNNIYDFLSWRPEVGRIGPLALDVLGLKLR